MNRSVRKTIKLPFIAAIVAMNLLHHKYHGIRKDHIQYHKMAISVGWHRNFRYRHDSGAALWMSGARRIVLFNVLWMAVALKCFFVNLLHLTL